RLWEAPDRSGEFEPDQHRLRPFLYGSLLDRGWRQPRLRHLPQEAQRVGQPAGPLRDEDGGRAISPGCSNIRARYDQLRGRRRADRDHHFSRQPLAVRGLCEYLWGGKSQRFSLCGLGARWPRQLDLSYEREPPQGVGGGWHADRIAGILQALLPVSALLPAHAADHGHAERGGRLPRRLRRQAPAVLQEFLRGRREFGARLPVVYHRPERLERRSPGGQP